MAFVFRASTPDFSQIFIGRQDWLDGLSPRQEGTLAGFSMQDGSIVLVDWKV